MDVQSLAGPRRQLAVFIDFENLALGFRGSQRFDVERMRARLVEKGNIVVKRAYADWKRFSSYTQDLHETAIELIEIPRRHMTGKNSADMRLCVDAMDLCYSKSHIDTFVIVSGDSDFSPLVSKLKENGKYVIGLGMQASTSELLRDNCDEFIYYEDLEAQAVAKVAAEPVLESVDEKRRKVFELLLESCEALRRENRDTLWSSMVKETMQRKRPSFNEAYFGYKTFSKLLEDAQARRLVELRRDESNRTYIVTRFGAELESNGGPKRAPEPAPSPAPVPEVNAIEGEAERQATPVAARPRRRRRGGRGRNRAAEAPADAPAEAAAEVSNQAPPAESPAPEAQPAKRTSRPRRRKTG
ncbi:MAG: NYN domain-containing protein [Planctomycetota bacterium]|nr:NYN domain-containing protein [Planctomycetota bacterium]